MSAELAILGGWPTFGEPLHVGRPNPGDRGRLLARIEQILDRNWLTNDGPVVRELEAALAEVTGVSEVVAVANGTLALGLAAHVLGFAGEVVVPSFTFVGTAHALRWIGLRPVFCDVDPVTHTADPASVAAAIGPDTSAVVPVHLWGNVCDTDAIEALAEDAGLRVVYDAAHALACGAGGRRVGGFGAAEAFSLHATKFVHSFEGGAVATSDPELADRLRLARNFGFAGYDRVEQLGINAKMPEVSAAMGLCSLEARGDVLARNTENRAAYADGLAGLPGVRLVGRGRNDAHNDQYVVLEIDAAGAGIDRDLLIEVLWAENVRARRYFTPGCHRVAPYVEENPSRSLPVTERLCDTVLALPTGLAVTPDDAGLVAALVARAIDDSARVRSASASAAVVP